ncbi:MAG: glycosyl transferase family protein [Alphaproteobacteria bacterium]
MEHVFAILAQTADAAQSSLTSLGSDRDLHDVLVANWGVLQFTIIVVAIIIFISSLDDLLIDVAYWFIRLWQILIGRPEDVSTKKVVAKPEHRIAVIVPAWHEADVIAHMLSNTANLSQYQNFEIFVGVYPNDPQTDRAVASVSQFVSKVHKVVVGRPGPTSKADCLNQVIRHVLRTEKPGASEFDIFLMHDAEDVPHPFGLRTVNWFIEGHGMIQLPVYSVNRDAGDLVAGHYMDEFAEWHGKELVVRSALSNMTPAAGVATAFSRKAVLALCNVRGDGPFNTESLTEDYEVAHKLRELGFKSRFIRFWARMPATRKSWITGKDVNTSRRELVATRELFPDTISSAYRQKARWLLGIAYFGWRQLGWKGDLVNRYFLWRDRKMLFTAPTAMIGYLLVVEYLAYSGLAWAFPGTYDFPPLVTQAWVWRIIEINLVFLAIRLAHRALFTGYTHGLKYMWLSPVRAVISNYVSFRAFLRAQRIFLWHRLTRKQVVWDKTQHRYPESAKIENGNGANGAWNDRQRETLPKAA